MVDRRVGIARDNLLEGLLDRVGCLAQMLECALRVLHGEVAAIRREILEEQLLVQHVEGRDAEAAAAAAADHKRIAGSSSTAASCSRGNSSATSAVTVAVEIEDEAVARVLGEGVADALRHVDRLGDRRRREAMSRAAQTPAAPAAAPTWRRPRPPPTWAHRARRRREASAAAGAAAAGGVPPPSASWSPHRDASDERAAGGGAALPLLFERRKLHRWRRRVTPRAGAAAGDDAAGGGVGSDAEAMTPQEPVQPPELSQERRRRPYKSSAARCLAALRTSPAVLGYTQLRDGLVPSGCPPSHAPSPATLTCADDCCVAPPYAIAARGCSTCVRGPEFGEAFSCARGNTSSADRHSPVSSLCRGTRRAIFSRRERPGPPRRQAVEHPDRANAAQPVRLDRPRRVHRAPACAAPPCPRRR